MNSEHSTNKHLSKIRNEAIKNAAHGDFFFAKWATSDGYIRESPCLVISDYNNDPHNEINVLKVTSKPGRTDFDVPIQLKRPSVVRTNKIYTINRNQLLFPITKALEPDEYNEIISRLKKALRIDQ